MKEATIQKIKSIEPIANADNIELVKFENIYWQCVVKKGVFQVEDKCVYIQIDSVVPDIHVFSFLKESKFRVTTKKLRGTLSQGLVISLLELDWLDKDYNIGDDVSELLGVIHYEKPVLISDFGENHIEGYFPNNILSKTDEVRIQNEPQLIEELKNMPYYISEKADGTSATYIKLTDKLIVCSRNLSLKRTDTSSYWKMADKYNLGGLPNNYAIQGELVGNGIQGNHMGVNGVDLLVFNVYEINLPYIISDNLGNNICLNNRMLSLQEMEEFCEKYELKTVKVLERGEFRYNIDELLELSKGNYSSGNKREGIVVRPTVPFYSNSIGKRFSFKVINNDYLLKNKE